jgi:SAM-dependent methyltransferase
MPSSARFTTGNVVIKPDALKSVGLVVCHGWGYGADDMKPLVKALQVHWPAAQILEISLGYDDTPQTSETALVATLRQHRDTSWLAVGHSWGFAWLLQQDVDWAAAVSLNGFARFCRKNGAASGTPARLLEGMSDRLASAPEATLAEFWSRVGQASKHRRHHQADRLREDLLAMRDTDVTLPDCPILALASRNDVIVAPALSEACFPAHLAQLRWFESDHALPLHAPQECARAIRDFVSRLDPVVRRFDRHAAEYESAATVQRNAASEFALWLSQCAQQLNLAAPAKIAELGCGTGFLTGHLLRQYPKARLLATDLSPAMVAQCAHQLGSEPGTAGRLRTEVCDARTVNWKAIGADPDWTVSAMCFQWFDDVPQVVAHLSSQTRVLAFSVMLDGSFAEWRQAHARVGAECGLRALPSWDSLNLALQALASQERASKPWKLASHRLQVAAPMQDGLSFARMLRAIGADAAAPGHQPVNLRPVLRSLSAGFVAHYDIGFFLLAR